MTKKYFHEVIEEEEKILAIGLKQSRLHKAERLSREKKRWHNAVAEHADLPPSPPGGPFPPNDACTMEFWRIMHQ